MLHLKEEEEEVEVVLEEEDRKKRLLILDLDQTCIFSKEYFYGSDDEEIENLVVNENQRIFETDDKDRVFLVTLRPGLHDFIEKAIQDWDLAIWSSADSVYVEKISQIAFPEGTKFVFKYDHSRCKRKRYYTADGCLLDDGPVLLKSLSKIWRGKAIHGYNRFNTLILEDTKSTCRENYGNAIFVKPFLGEEDRELDRVYSILQKKKEMNDVRMN